MGEKKSPFAPWAFVKTASKGISLAQQYFSGELEQRHREAVKAGDSPWRIVRYQRIIDPESAPYPISNFSYVTPATFEKHLRLFKKDCNLISLEDLIRAVIAKSELPAKTVAITLDGGWVDHLVHALPVLHKFQIPATALLPTAFIGTSEFFWQDKVMFILLAIQRADIPVQPFPFFPESVKQAIAETAPDGKISMPLISLYISGLAQSSFDDRLAGLLTLGKAAEHVGANYPAENVFLDWNEVRTMERAGIRIGGLGHAHDFFEDFPAEAVKNEIRLAAQTLTEELQSPSPVFALPDGVVTDAAISALKELNLPYALGTDACPPPGLQADSLKILRRVSLYDAVSARAEALFSTIWDLGE